MGSGGGFVGFEVDSLGRVLDIGVVFCGAGWVGLSRSCTTHISRHHVAIKGNSPYF